MKPFPLFEGVRQLLQNREERMITAARLSSIGKKVGVEVKVRNSFLTQQQTVVCSDPESHKVAFVIVPAKGTPKFFMKSIFFYDPKGETTESPPATMFRKARALMEELGKVSSRELNSVERLSF